MKQVNDGFIEINKYKEEGNKIMLKLRLSKYYGISLKDFNELEYNEFLYLYNEFIKNNTKKDGK